MYLLPVFLSRPCLLLLLTLFSNMPSFFLLLPKPFLLPLCLGWVTPCDIPLQMIEQVEASGFELVPDEAKSEQPDTETVFVVCGDGPIRFCVLLIVSLGGDRKTELDVCLDLLLM